MVTQLISTHFAESYKYCAMSLVDIYIYVRSQIEIYEAISDDRGLLINNNLTTNESQAALNFGQSFLQNLIGNVITIQNYYQKIIIAQENEDQRMTIFIGGKIVYTVLDFEPIEEASFEEPDEYS